MPEQLVTKKPAKKTVKKMTRKTVVKKPTTKSVVKPRMTRTPTSTTRKAPTPLAEHKAHASRMKRSMIVGSVVFVGMLAVSVGIGVSDQGAIVVSSAINEQKQNATPEERVNLDKVSNGQSREVKPFGGLVGAGKSAPVAPRPVVEMSSSTASSSEVMASSSDNAVEEVVEVIATSSESFAGTSSPSSLDAR